MRTKLKHALVAPKQVRYMFGQKLDLKLFARHQNGPKRVDVKCMHNHCLAVNVAVASVSNMLMSELIQLCKVCVTLSCNSSVVLSTLLLELSPA